MSSERPSTSNPTRLGGGSLLVVSSPSGAGKTTLCSRLRQEFPQIGFSVSYTTRKPRPGETDGVEYNFVSFERFQEMAAKDEFAEYAMVHGNMYGTAANQVEDAIVNGRDLLFDIDFQGGRQLRRRFPNEVVLVFILPPSLRELERRLRRRATDADEVIAQRLKVARSELAHYDEYDYLIVNDDLDNAYDGLRAIYVASLHGRERQAARARALIDGQEALPW
ncbi:guanylate kinase [Nannocystaceae bacterium ST9]